MLGFLGSKVLGQFDPFHAPYGRLLLVAPNIVHVEREIGADPHDFRLWVCLHEETHRVQFTANPWLGEHLMTQMHAVADTIEPSAVLDGLRRGAERDPRRQRQHPRPRLLARAEGDPRPGHRRDVAARGPRRRGDGRRRPDRHPVGRGDPQEVQPAPPGRRHPRQAAAPAARPRRQDGAVPRRRRLRPPRRRQGRHGGVQRGVDAAPRPCRPRPRSPTPTPGSPACCDAPPVGRGGPARRCAGRCPASRLEPAGAVVAVACSGGADSLALASARRLRGPQAAACGSSA